MSVTKCEVADRSMEVTIGNKVVKRYNICTTHVWVHAVYEPATMSSHSTITWIGGKLYGRIGTRTFLCTLKPGPERSEEVRRHHQRQHVEAEELIFQAFPWLIGSDKTSRDGEIETIEE